VEDRRQWQLSPEEHAALLKADAEICDLLRFYGFEGLVYEKWEMALMKDTLGRLSANIRSGRAFDDPRTRRYVRPSPAHQRLLQTDPHEALSLANMAIALTLPRFRRDALLERGWNPDRGATLQHYFYGSVLQTLPQAYRDWKRSQKHIKAVELMLWEGHDCDQDGSRRPEPPSRLQQIEDFDQALAAVPQKYHEVAVLLFRGLQVHEVAQKLAMSPRDVTKTKQRIKTALRRAGYGRKGGDPTK
jgi:DNA-directed RNA polymerase specialized sigma24 family protein